MASLKITALLALTVLVLAAPAPLAAAASYGYYGTPSAYYGYGTPVPGNYGYGGGRRLQSVLPSSDGSGNDASNNYHRRLNGETPCFK